MLVQISGILILNYIHYDYDDDYELGKVFECALACVCVVRALVYCSKHVGHVTCTIHVCLCSTGMHKCVASQAAVQRAVGALNRVPTKQWAKTFSFTFRVRRLYI